MLWLALIVPELPLQIVLQKGLDTPDKSAAPLAVVDGPPNRQNVLYLNRAARDAGVLRGMSVSAASALCSALRVVAREPSTEAAALEHLACLAGVFTPNIVLMNDKAVGVDIARERQGLLLEVSGSVRLFGSVAKLQRKLLLRMTRAGFHVRSALAPTAQAAWWEACTREGLQCAAMANLKEQLAKLPLTATAWPEATLDTFATLGVTTLGAVITLPRGDVARRFGQTVMDELDSALGRRPYAATWFTPPTEFTLKHEYLEEVEHLEALYFTLQRLLGELQVLLRSRLMGVQSLALTLTHDRFVHPEPTRLNVGALTPLADARAWLMLCRERLERAGLEHPVRQLTLEARNLLPLTATHGELFSNAALEGQSFKALHARLQARLGDECLFVLTAANDHRPELSAQRLAHEQVVARLNAPKPTRRKQKIMDQVQPSNSAGRVGTAVVPSTGHMPPAKQRRAAHAAKPHAVQTSTTEPQRPLWLLSKPKRVSINGFIQESGPERIESGWWELMPERFVARDYYVVLTPNHERWWVYCEHSAPKLWWLQGVFG